MRIFKKIGLIIMLLSSHVCACDKLGIENWLNDVNEKKIETREKIKLIDKCQARNFRIDDDYNAIFWMLEHARHNYFSQLHKETRREELLKAFKKERSFKS